MKFALKAGYRRTRSGSGASGPSRFLDDQFRGLINWRRVLRQRRLVEVSGKLDDRNKNLVAAPATDLERQFAFVVEVVQVATPISRQGSNLVDVEHQHTGKHRL